MKLILMRHGTTQGNEEHRYVGKRTDVPLSSAGRAQCAQAGVFPQVNEVFCSPMLRAHETAALCFPRAVLRPVEGLEEFDFGAFEGRSADEMADEPAYRSWVDGWCEGPCPGGESRGDFVTRSNAALAKLLREELAQGVGQVVVVAHGGTIMAALSALSTTPAAGDPYFGWQVGPCEGYAADVREREGRLALDNPVRFSRPPL